MARLPNPGSDDGRWGGILNEYLQESHNPDGTIKNSVITSQMISGTFPASKITGTALVSTQLGSANGVASLDGNGLLSASIDASKITAGTVDMARLPDMSATYSQLADEYSLRQLDATGAAAARRLSGQSAIDYADATEIDEDWTNLTSWQAGGVQALTNKLYSTSSVTSPSAAARACTLTGKFRITTSITWKTGGSAAATYVGINCDSSGATPTSGGPNGIFIGVNGSGVTSYLQGANMTNTVVGIYSPALAVDGTTYLINIIGDEEWISFSMRPVGSTTIFFGFRVSRASLVILSKTPANIHAFVSDARGTSGNAIGPLVARTSQQPARTKTVGGFTIEGSTHVDVVRESGTTNVAGTEWRIQLPANYDARLAAPVCIYMHQSTTGNAYWPYSDSRMQPLTQALGAAGYILASADTAGDSWGNTYGTNDYTALYKYIRSHWSTGPVVFLGVSMGLLSGLNLLAQRTMSVAAVASVGGAYDLDFFYSNNTGPYASFIRTAYGVATDGSDYAAKTAGFNPKARDGREFRGTPFWYATSTGDPTVPWANNGQLLFSAINPYALEATKFVGGGGHLDVSQFPPSTIVSFFDKYARVA